MDPIFNEKCADEAITASRFRYRLMKNCKNQYQWRWVDLPPDYFHAELSPVFDSIERAVKWKAYDATPSSLPLNAGWVEVDVDA